jgi:osmotically-inducible protein OsmY
MIKTTVRRGWLSLERTVEWQYQRATAETAVRRIKGVKGVDNLINLEHASNRTTSSEISKRRFGATLRWMPIMLRSKPMVARLF